MKDLILLSDYEGYVYIIYMFIWVFNKIFELWKYFLGGWGGGEILINFGICIIFGK